MPSRIQKSGAFLSPSSEADDGLRQPLREVRILIADDHPEILLHATRLLQQEFSTVEAVLDGESVLRDYESRNPDVVVLDISLSTLSGIDVARRLLELGHRAKIVFLTVHEQQEFLRAAFAAGGTAYVVKSRLNSDLVDAIRAVLSGRIFISPTLLRTSMRCR